MSIEKQIFGATYADACEKHFHRPLGLMEKVTPTSVTPLLAGNSAEKLARRKGVQIIPSFQDSKA
jgi:hypothetical protein